MVIMEEELKQAVSSSRDRATEDVVKSCVQVVNMDMRAALTPHTPDVLCKLFYIMGATGLTIKEAERLLGV